MTKRASGVESDEVPPVTDEERSDYVRYCIHCHLSQFKHSTSGKCLFEPTYYEPDPDPRAYPDNRIW